MRLVAGQAAALLQLDEAPVKKRSLPAQGWPGFCGSTFPGLAHPCLIAWWGVEWGALRSMLSPELQTHQHISTPESCPGPTLAPPADISPPVGRGARQMPTASSPASPPPSLDATPSVVCTQPVPCWSPTLASGWPPPSPGRLALSLGLFPSSELSRAAQRFSKV